MTAVDDFLSYLDAGRATSAVNVIMDELEKLGLGSLAQRVWQWHLEGRPDELIALDVENSQEFKDRFPAMQKLKARGRAISPGQYINLEQAYATLARQFGLPTTFYDQPSDFAKLIENEVSPAEFSTRLQMYEQLAYDTDPTTRQELRRLYNVNEGDIAAFLIDADRALPLITQKVRSAEVAAQAQRSGFGALTELEAERLAFLDRTTAGQGFGNLVRLREVLTQLPGEAEAGVSRQTALDAAFQGDQEAAQQIERRADRRKAQFQAGGSYSTSQTGIAGVG